ncbi:MAG: hypothetical protein KIT79_02895 [Deltaproteobacteria bacterium]|nr:hypothetical protein [Deltaproteobacteria bacterium]
MDAKNRTAGQHSGCGTGADGARTCFVRVKSGATMRTIIGAIRNSALAMVLALGAAACGMGQQGEHDAQDEAQLVTRAPETAGSAIDIKNGSDTIGTISEPQYNVSSGNVIPLNTVFDTLTVGGAMTGAAVQSAGNPHLANAIRVIAWLDRPPYNNTTGGSFGTEDRRIFDTGNTYQNDTTDGVYTGVLACPALATVPASSAGALGVGGDPADLNAALANCRGSRILAASGQRQWNASPAVDLTVDPAVSGDTLHVIRVEFFRCANSACTLGSEVRIGTTLNYCAGNCDLPFAAPASPDVGDLLVTRDSIPPHVLNTAFTRAFCDITVANSVFNAGESFVIAGRTYTVGTHFQDASPNNAANQELVAQRIVAAVNADQFANNGSAVTSFTGGSTVFRVWSLVRGAAGNAITVQDESSGVTNNLTGCGFTNPSGDVRNLTGGADGTSIASPLMVGDFPTQLPFGPVGYIQHFADLDVSAGGTTASSTKKNFAALNVAQNDLLVIQSGVNGGDVRRIVPALPRAGAPLSTMNLSHPLTAAGTGVSYGIYHADVQQLRFQTSGTTTKGQSFAERNHGFVNQATVSGVIWDGTSVAPPQGAATREITNGAAGGADDVLLRANAPGAWGNQLTVTKTVGAAAVTIGGANNLDITVTFPDATPAQTVVNLINNHPGARNLVTAQCSIQPCAGNAVSGGVALASFTGGRGSNVTSVTVKSTNTQTSVTSETTTMISRSGTVGTPTQIVVDDSGVTDDAIRFHGPAGDTTRNGATVSYVLPGADFTRQSITVAGTPGTVTVNLERTSGATARSTAEEIIDAVNNGNYATLFTAGADANGRVRVRARAAGTDGNSIQVAYVNNATPSVVVSGTAPNIVVTVNTPIPGTTATAVANMINTSTDASQWVYASVARGTTGASNVSAFAATNLAGGTAWNGWLKAMTARGDTGAGIPTVAATPAAAVMRGAAATGALVSSNPKIIVAPYWGGNCNPSNVTLNHESIGTSFAAICYTAVLDLTEGNTVFEVRANDATGNATRDGSSCTSAGATDLCHYPATTNLIVDRTPPQLLSQYGNGTLAATGFESQKVWAQGATNPGAGAYQTFASTVAIRGLVKDFVPGTITVDDTTSRDSGRTYVRVQSDYLGYDSFAISGGTDARGSPIPATDADVTAPSTADRGYYHYDNVPLRPGGITSFTVTGWDQAGNSATHSFTVQHFEAATTTPPAFALDCIVDNVPRNAGGTQILACEMDDFTPNTNSPIVIRTQAPEIGGATGDPCENDPSANGRFGDCGAPSEQTSALTFSGLPTGTIPPLSQTIVSADRVSFSGRYLTLEGLPPTVLVNGSGGVFTNFDIMPRDSAGSSDVLGTVASGGGGTNQIVTGTAVTNLNLRPGDALSLSSLDPNQSSNVGLYQIEGCTTNAAGACTGTGLTLNRVLSQSATGMFYQAAWIWMANNLVVPAEGVNTFSFKATDALGNERNYSIPVLRDTQPPAIVIQGIFVDPSSLDPVEMQSVNPIVFITDSSMFFGTSVSNPRSYISVKRSDSNGEGLVYSVTTGASPTVFTSTTATNACRRAVNECVGREVRFLTTGGGSAQNLGVTRSITASTVGGQITVNPAYPQNVLVGDTFVIVPATEHFAYTGSGVAEGANRASSLDNADNTAGVGYSCTAGSALSGVNALGQATAATRAAPLGVQPLTCDFSCTNKDGNPNNQCTPGSPLTYEIVSFAVDRGNRSSTAQASFSLVESTAGALLGGALGVLSTNPALVSALSDSTGLRTLALDQVSTSGVLYNLNYRMATLLGDPNQPISATVNTRANFYLDSRDKFGSLLGTVLTDPDGSGSAQSTAVTLANVVRILLDNGVFDDVLPILDDTRILDPKARTNFPSGPDQGDASKMSDFMEKLLRDPNETGAACNVGPHAQEAYTCFANAGPVKETFDAIKATLDYGDSLRMKNASTRPRVSGTNAVLTATTVTSATGSFQPVGAVPTSVVNVQPGDIVTITQTGSSCNTSTAEVVSITSNTVLVTTNWSANCVTDCGGGCEFRITPPAGPALNAVIELADIMLFADLDADGRGGEREAIQGILHLIEEGMRNISNGAETTYDRISLLCPANDGVADPCAATATTAAQMLNFTRGRNIQGSLDLFAELADNNDANDGTEFVSQVLNLVNFLLQEHNDAGDPGGPPKGATNIEAKSFIAKDMFQNLLQEPSFTNPNLVSMTSPTTRQNTRLNLLLRSIAALSYDRTPVTINFGSPSNPTADNAIEATLSLIHTLANDPDDNPRGCGNPACGVLVPPGSNEQKSIIDKLETPLDTLLQDSRFPTLLLNLSSVLDPGSGISDFTAFQYTGNISEQPFTTTLSPNPYTVNPPLLRVLMEFSKSRIDGNLNGTFDTGEKTPVDVTVDALNVLLTPIGTDTGGEDFDPVLLSVNTDVCREAWFQGRTPMELLLDIVAQLAQPATKDPKDYDYRNRTLPDCHATVAEGDPKSDNRTYIRIILDALTDDPDTDDDNSTAATNSVVAPNAFSIAGGDASNVNGWDDVTPGVTAGYRAGNRAFHNNITTGSCSGAAPSGTRKANAGDGLAVPQRTLDILPEILNTLTRYGFNNSDQLTSIFANCVGAACEKNNGYPTGTQRWLSGQRMMIDLGLIMDQPIQIGGGTTGIVSFEQSLTREFIEAIANLTSTQAVNQVVLLFDRMTESIAPVTGTLKIPNPEDVTRSTSLIRALADPDGDGDPLPDGIVDDLVPLIQAISAAGMTQQVLDLLRAVRACGVDIPSGEKDVRGGELLLQAEDVTLTMLDAFSGALKDTALGGYTPSDPTLAGGTAPSTDGAGLCPQEGPAPGGPGLAGGILDSNPNGATSASYPVNRGVITAGDDLRVFVEDNEGGIGGVANNFRVFAGNWASAVNSTVGAAPAPTASVFAGSGLSGVAGDYVGSLLTITSGALINRSRVVTAYNGTTLTVTPPFSAVPAAGVTFTIVAPSRRFGQLGVGVNGFVCVVQTFTPYDEACGVILSSDTAGTAPYHNGTPSTTGGYLRFNNTTSGNLGNVVALAMGGCDQRNPAGFTSGGKCSYRIRQMREPYNGCVGGVAFGGTGFGVRLSSSGGLDPIQTNSFRDSRLDLMLRQLNFLADGGNEVNLTTSSFSRRLSNLINTIGTPDTLLAKPSILSTFMFGVAGPSSGETGPLQALLNDSAARSALAGTLNLFSQTAAAVAVPGVSGEDPLDRFPNFIAASGWAEPAGANCINSATTCDGNGIHDAVDYQLLAVQGLLAILGDQDGADNISGINGTASAARQGWSDDPGVLFRGVSQMLQEKYISNLVPGLQIISEATTAVPMSAMDVRANPEAANAPLISNKIEAKALSRITRRTAKSVNGGEEGVCGECNWPAASFPAAQGGILANLGAAPNGVYEGPIQGLVKTVFGILDQWESNRDYDSTAGVQPPFGATASSSLNNRMERSRFVAIEDLVGTLTGATGGPKHLNKALSILYDIVLDTSAGPTVDRSINKILSVQVGLAQRGVVDPLNTNKSALDVVADFINTLVEDPTDCDAVTNGFQRGSGTSTLPQCDIGSANHVANPNAVFRDVGPLVERPIQPILDPTAFTSLSQLFAGGDNSKITGALPFLAALVRDSYTKEIQNKPPTGTATVVYRGIEYSAGVLMADALFADIQDLIPDEDENRYDPLLTDDMNRNGRLDGASVTLAGFGSSAAGPWMSIFDQAAVAACIIASPGVCPHIEVDNIAFDCSPRQGTPNGTVLQNCTAANGTPLANGVPNANFADRRLQIGFTAADGGVTIGNVNGINAAFFDVLADLIALEDYTRIVNNQLPRTNTGQTMDHYTARALGVKSVDPAFNDMITALGDLLLQSNQ